MTRDMNEYIANSTNVELRKPKLPEWYSWDNQRKMNYELAKALLLTEDMTPEEAIDTALEFHSIFFDKVLRYTRK